MKQDATSGSLRPFGHTANGASPGDRPAAAHNRRWRRRQSPARHCSCVQRRPSPQRSELPRPEATARSSSPGVRCCLCCWSSAWSSGSTRGAVAVLPPPPPAPAWLGAPRSWRLSFAPPSCASQSHAPAAQKALRDGASQCAVMSARASDSDRSISLSAADVTHLRVLRPSSSPSFPNHSIATHERDPNESLRERSSKNPPPRPAHHETKPRAVDAAARE